jgi:membrane-bound ClpP family serine protease
VVEMVYCKECGKEYQLEPNENLSDFQCTCGGDLTRQYTKADVTSKTNKKQSHNIQEKFIKEYVDDFRSYFAFILIINSFIGGFVLSPIFFVGIILAILLYVTASWIIQFLIIIYLLIFGFLALFGGLILMIYGVIMLITGFLLAHNWFSPGIFNIRPGA